MACNVARELGRRHLGVVGLQGLVAVEDEALADLQRIDCLGKSTARTVASSGGCGDFDVVDDFKHDDNSWLGCERYCSFG